MSENEMKERLAHYQAQGLVDCRQNADAIISWLVRNGRDVATSAIDIDQAIEEFA
jgi:hypothetical protein